MKWVLIVLGVIIGLVAIVAVVGAFLPESHVASRTVKFNQPPEQVWEAIAGFASAPEWRDFKSMEQLPDRHGNQVWRETSDFGPVTYEVTEFDPPWKMVTVIADENLPFGGSWTYEVFSDGEGSTLTITENGEIYNLFFRFMARFLFGYTATIEGYLKALGKKFGEEVVIIET